MGITFEVYLKNTSRKSMEQDLLSAEGEVANIKEQVIALCASSPYPVKDSEGYPIDWDDHITYKVNDIFDSLWESMPRASMLECAKYGDGIVDDADYDDIVDTEREEELKCSECLFHDLLITEQPCMDCKGIAKEMEC